MFLDHIQSSSSAFLESLTEYTIDTFTNNCLFRRIKELAEHIFAGLSIAFEKVRPAPANIKTIGILGCMCLVTLMIISIFFKRDPFFPFTPRKQQPPPQNLTRGRSSSAKTLNFK